MTSLILLAALIGATLIIVRGTIFRSLQTWLPSLFRCAQCTGFWVGVVAGASRIVVVGQGRLVDAMLVGAATSFLAMAADALLVTMLGEPEEKS